MIPTHMAEPVKAPARHAVVTPAAVQLSKVATIALLLLTTIITVMVTMTMVTMVTVMIIMMMMIAWLQMILLQGGTMMRQWPTLMRLKTMAVGCGNGYSFKSNRCNGRHGITEELV
jgi:hypothetical protein